MRLSCSADSRRARTSRARTDGLASNPCEFGSRVVAPGSPYSGAELPLAPDLARRFAASFRAGPAAGLEVAHALSSGAGLGDVRMCGFGSTRTALACLRRAREPELVSLVARGAEPRGSGAM